MKETYNSYCDHLMEKEFHNGQRSYAIVQVDGQVSVGAKGHCLSASREGGKGNCSHRCDVLEVTGVFPIWGTISIIPTPPIEPEADPT